MKTPEYIEGPKAQENFERTMVRLFRAPKPKARKQPTAATGRKSKKNDRD
jgi:hypothetical protein